MTYEKQQTNRHDPAKKFKDKSSNQIELQSWSFRRLQFEELRMKILNELKNYTKITNEIIHIKKHREWNFLKNYFDDSVTKKTPIFWFKLIFKDLKIPSRKEDSLLMKELEKKFRRNY